jgi:hypothetical protein
MARTNQRAIPIALIVIAALLLIARIASHFLKDEPKLEQSTATGVKWMSHDDGLATARATGKPILYDFTAEWCPPCHLLDEEVFRDAQFAAEINRRFVPVRVLDRQQEEGRNPPHVAALQQQYRIDGFPTVIFASTDGIELARTVGFPGADEFRRVMGSVR